MRFPCTKKKEKEKSEQNKKELARREIG